MAHVQRACSAFSRLAALLIASVVLIIACLLPSVAFAQTTGSSPKTFGTMVVFVQFSDNDGTFLQDEAQVNKLVDHFADDSTSSRSLHGYLDAISYGQFDVESHLPQYDAEAGTITPVTLDDTYQSYVDANSSYQLLSDANAKLSEAGYDASAADTDGDGAADNVIYIFDGGGSDSASILYSHKEDYEGDASSFGSRVRTVNVVTGDVVFDIGGFGTINHEFMHSIGYPDLYKDSNEYDPVGRWDLMASVSNFVQYPLTYLRSTEYTESPGWLTIDTIDTPTQGVTLVPASQAEGDQAYILKSSLSSSEFFVVEYRQQAPLVLDSTAVGFDALDMKIPGTGLIVYRVNTQVEHLNNRTSSTDGIYVFRADQGDSTASDGLDASFFSADSERTAIGTTDLSVTDGALTFSDGSNSGIYIHDIGSAGDTISFDVDFADSTDAGLWASVGEADVASTASFDMAIAVDGTTVYAAYDSAGSLIIATSSDGGAWEQLGGSLSNFGQGAQVCVFDGVPYVSYVDSRGWQTQVYKYTGSAWDKVAGLGSGYSYANTALIAGTDGVYLAYTDNSEGLTNNTHVVRIDAVGNTTELYAETSGERYGSQLRLSVDGSTVYFSYRNGDTPIIVQIDALETATLPALPTSTGLGDVAVAADSGHLFASASDSAGVRVWEYADATWPQLGSNLSATSAYSSSFAASHGEPFVLLARQDGSETNNTVVMRLVDGAWTQEGLPVDSGKVGTAQLVAVASNLYAGVTSPRSGAESYPVVKTKAVDFGEPVEPPVEPPIDPPVTTTSLATASVTAPKQQFTGSAIAPIPVVTLGGQTLVEGTDYEVTGYADNTNVGSATITVTGMGEYTDTATGTFTIFSALSYRTHVQNIGWQEYVGVGAMAGTTGQSLRLESITINADTAALGTSGGIRYKVHVQNQGWTDWKSGGEDCGTTGSGLRLEAIRIELTGDLATKYDVYYRVHAQDVGWMGWAKNGQESGTAGYSLRLEGIQIMLVAKGAAAPADTFEGITQNDTHCAVDYNECLATKSNLIGYTGLVHVQNTGDVYAGGAEGTVVYGDETLGTTGQSLRLEALRLSLDDAAGVSGGIQYRTHVQSIGWQKWVKNGDLAGTQGQSLRLEAVQIRLIGDAALDYDVYYRTHVQNIGWTGWATNGQQCGSAGYSYRMEAMQVIIVEKGAPAPGTSVGCFYQA